MVELLINGKRAEVKDTDFAYNLQVNTFFDFDKRNTSYSNSIKLPRTPNNTQIFEMAGVLGNISKEPYKEMAVVFRVNTIEIVSNGVGRLVETTPTDYIFFFQDGNVNLYNALGEKTIKGVFNSDEKKELRNENPNFETYGGMNELVMYPIADYGRGLEVGFPAVSVYGLMGRIAQKLGFSFSGRIFEELRKEHLYLVNSGKRTKEESTEFSFEKVIKIPLRRGRYKWTMEGVADWYFSEEEEDIERQRGYRPGYDRNDIWDTRGEQDFTENEIQYPLQVGVQIGRKEIWRFSPEKNVVHRKELEFFAEEDTFLDVWNITEPIITKYYTFKGTIKIEPLSVSAISDIEEMQIKDFFKHFLILFGVTPMQDKLNPKKYHFYTLEERLTKAPLLDWSEKFVKVESEKYMYGDYGKSNYFNYKKYSENGTFSAYANEEVNFNNVHLKEKYIFESIFFAPERKKQTERFLYWEGKENTTDDGRVYVTYQLKENRPHLMKLAPVNDISVMVQKTIVNKDTFKTEEITSNVVIEDGVMGYFGGLEWANLYKKYYNGFTELIGTPKYVKIECVLNEIDIHEFDFYSRIYIKQLGGVFLPLKIGYKEGRLAQVELLEIKN